MTDRYAAFTVVLDQDMRDDDAQVVINAIRQIRGVLDVKPYLSDPDISIAQMRVKCELREKLFKVLE